MLSSFRKKMNLITQLMGVSCNTCHSPRGNFVRDEKPEQWTARRVLEMTKSLNKQFFFAPGPEIIIRRIAVIG
jgi:hypothetical protein